VSYGNEISWPGKHKLPESKKKAQPKQQTRPPLPPFTHETAIQKVRLAEDGWNSRDPEKGGACLHDRLTVEKIVPNFLTAVRRSSNFLDESGARELDYRLIKELWAHDGKSHCGFVFAYEMA